MLEVGARVESELKAAGLRVELDARDSLKPGAKYFEWEARGVPLRLEIGPRDVAASQVDGGAAHRRQGAGPARRDRRGARAGRSTRSRPALFAAARERREAASVRGITKEHFIEFMQDQGGFAYGGFCGGGRVRGGDQGGDRRNDAGAPRSGVPLSRGAHDLHVVRQARAWPRRCGRRRTRVRPGAARRDRGARRDAGVRLRGEPDPGAVSTRWTTRCRGSRIASATRSRRTATSPSCGCCSSSARAPTSCRWVSCGAPLRPGSRSDLIVFSGVGKTAAELEEAIRARIGFLNIESTSELDAVIGAAAAHRPALSARDPGQPRCGDRDASLHQDGREDGEVRRAVRRRGERGPAHRGRAGAGAARAWRCTSGRRSPTWSPITAAR